MFQFASDLFQFLSETFHLPVDQAKAGFCLLSSFIIAIFFSKLRGEKLRLYFGLIVGLFLQAIIYEAEIITTFLACTCVYLILKNQRRRSVKPVTIFIFLYTSIYHLYRMYYNWGGWKIDASFSLMIMVAKYNSFAWCYRDGDVPESSLTEDQRYRRVVKLPSYTEFLSYSFFFVGGSFLAPFFDYKDFELFIKQEDRYKNAPSGFKMSLLMIVLGVLSSVGYELFTPTFNITYIQTYDFAQKSLLYKLGYVFITGYVVRLKYHSGFSLSQASVDASGLSYSGINDKGEHEFEAVLMAGRFTEISPNARSCLEKWNCSIHVWLKRCVYQRMIDYDTRRGKKPDTEKASLTTFAVSAFWHGFYPSYYTTFFFMFCQIEFGRSYFRAKDRLKFPPLVYKTIDYFLSMFNLAFASVNHVTLDWMKCLRLYQETFCIPVVIPIVLWTALRISGLSRKSRKAKEENIKEKAH